MGSISQQRAVKQNLSNTYLKFRQVVRFKPKFFCFLSGMRVGLSSLVCFFLILQPHKVCDGPNLSWTPEHQVLSQSIETADHAVHSVLCISQRPPIWLPEGTLHHLRVYFGLFWHTCMLRSSNDGYASLMFCASCIFHHDLQRELQILSGALFYSLCSLRVSVPNNKRHLYFFEFPLQHFMLILCSAYFIQPLLYKLKFPQQGCKPEVFWFAALLCNLRTRSLLYHIIISVNA